MRSIFALLGIFMMMLCISFTSANEVAVDETNFMEMSVSGPSNVSTYVLIIENKIELLFYNIYI